jgi:glucose/mannose-6-phosphate isomerase
MTELDDHALREHLDPDGSFERNRTLPEQCTEAWAAVRDLNMPPDYSDFEHVIVAGMGGSAIAGDLLQALSFQEGRIPVTPVRGYEMPRWAGKRTLVIVCSHSGDTEETLASYARAKQQGAKLIAITTGGRLLTLATNDGFPVLQYEYPPEPRAALGHGFIRLLAIARAIGALDFEGKRIENAIASLEKQRLDLDYAVPESENPAKQLARRLYGRLPLIVGAGCFYPVARRWKTQLNENPEVWSFFDEMTELHHNTVVGLRLPEAVAQHVYAVLLESPIEPERMTRRYDVTVELFGRLGVTCERLDVGGSEPLEAMLRGVFYANFVSSYLTVLNGVAPGRVENIDWLKQRLA